MKKIINLVLLFFLVFGFKLPFLNSTYLAGSIAFILILFKQGRGDYFIRLFKNKYIFKLLVLTFLMAPVGVLIAIFHGTYDLSLAKQVVSQLPVFISSLLVFSVIYPSLKSENELLQLILEVFLIQAIIIILAFIIPSILEIVELLQYPDNSAQASSNRNNNVYRGLSLSGDLFFGLSASFGLIYVFFTKYILDKDSLGVIDVLIGLILIIGNVFIARIGFVGLLFALILFLFYKSKHIKVHRFFKVIFVAIISIALFWILIPKDLQYVIIESVMPFAFEFIYNYLESSEIGTSSTNHLLSMYDIKLSIKTFLFGDGYFTSESGAYYMKTDSGYLRQILFGGVFYFLFMILYQLQIFSVKKFKKTCTKREKFNYNLLVTVVFCYFLTIHSKGIAIGFMRMILIISWYYFTFINIYKSKSINKV
jgi:hypothetical protein